jgi:hypothetical protein
MRTEKDTLLHILAVDGLRSVVGLCRGYPQALGVLRTCVREGLVTVIRPRLKPTGYSRREIPTDIAALTREGRADAQRKFGRTAEAVSLVQEIEHRVGVGELRTMLRIPSEVWTSAVELHAARLIDACGAAGRGLPDGLADIDGIRLALEYDHGRYTAAQVRLKQKTFRRLADDAVWAAPTSRRAKWLQTLGCGRVVVIPLPLGVWEDQTVQPEAKAPALATF